MGGVETCVLRTAKQSSIYQKNASLFSINPFKTRKKKKNNLKITSAMKYVWVQFKTYNTIY